MEKALYSYSYKSIGKRDKWFLIFSLFGLFIGQAVFFSFANPFFAAFLSLFIGEKILVFSLILISLIIGINISFSGTFLYTYIFIGLLMFFVNIYINNKKIRLNNNFKSIICGICIIIGGLIPVITFNMSNYFIIYFFILAIVSGTISKILGQGFKILTLEKNLDNVKSKEIIGFSILISSIMVGVININFNGFNLFLYLVALLTLIISNSSMKNSTLTFTFIIGIVPFMLGKLTEIEFIIILLFSFSTLFALDKDKKITVISTLPVILISYLYINKNFFIQKNLLSILVSYLTFLLIPKNFYTNLQSIYGRVDNSFYPYEKKIKEYSKISLIKSSQAFKNLSRVFNNVAKIENCLTIEDYKEVSENVVNKVCKECKSYNSCYENPSYIRSNLINKLLTSIEKNDKESFDNLIFTFSKLCSNSELFVKVLDVYYEVLKNNKGFVNKQIENKVLIAEQLNEISEVLLNLKNDITNNITFLPKEERKIISILGSFNIYPSKVLVIKKINEVVNIFITIDVNLKEKDVLKVILSTCNDVLNKKFKVTKTDILSGGRYELNIEEISNFEISFGVSFKKKNEYEISGDSYSALNLNNNNAFLAISDGMGSGKEASLSSTLALDLFEEFLESGFNEYTAVKLINSSLILNNTKETFATIDAILIDLYNGVANFIKVGAVQSFILRDNKVISINSNSLPVGILKNIETKIYKKQLKYNDYVILMSDGVLDVISSYTNQEKWIKEVITTFKGKSSKALADFIIEEALKISNNKIKDDMTVVVGKVI